MKLLETSNPELYQKSVHRRFDDMHHGFAAARGDWNDPLQAQRAQEALNLVATFFKSILKYEGG
jgi:dienelactone hydrolase